MNTKPRLNHHGPCGGCTRLSRAGGPSIWPETGLVRQALRRLLFLLEDEDMHAPTALEQPRPQTRTHTHADGRCNNPSCRGCQPHDSCLYEPGATGRAARQAEQAVGENSRVGEGANNLAARNAGWRVLNLSSSPFGLIPGPPGWLLPGTEEHGGRSDIYTDADAHARHGSVSKVPSRLLFWVRGMGRLGGCVFAWPASHLAQPIEWPIVSLLAAWVLLPGRQVDSRS